MILNYVGEANMANPNRPSCCYRPNSLPCVKPMGSHQVRS